MSTISFRRIAPDESRIYRDGDHVGDIHAFDDSIRPGRRVFAIHLDEDPRGLVYLHDRTRIREVAGHLVLSHPLWG